MKPIYVIASIVIFIFGLMETLRDIQTNLGFILMFLGTGMFIVQLTKMRVEKLVDEDSESLAEQLKHLQHTEEKPLLKESFGSQ